MVLPDPGSSRVVLVGAERYESPHLHDLPAVANNLRALAEHLCDPLLWGIPAANCTVLHQPLDERSVLGAIRDAAEQATDALVIYYAGHGLVDPDTDELHLALSSTDAKRLFTAVEYARIRRELISAKRALRKVVILDCCFSGRAMIGSMAGPNDLMDLGQIEGTYLLVAAGETQVAVAPEGEQFTAFTGELVKALSEGIPGGSEFLDLDSLYKHIMAELLAKGRPRPHQRNRNAGGLIALGRNRSYVARSSGSFPSELTALLRGQHQAAKALSGQLANTHGMGMDELYIGQHLLKFRRAPDEVQGGVSRSARVGEARRMASGRPLGEILNRHQHLVVIGGPGLGKTTMAVQLARQFAMPWLTPELHDALAATGMLLPIRVEARDLAAHPGPFKTAIVDSASSLAGMALPSNLIDMAPAGACWLVLIDGLDEVSNFADRTELLHRLAEELDGDDSRLRLLVTSRRLPPHELAMLDSPSVGHYELQPFTRDQLKDFAERWFGIKGRDRSDRQSFLSRLNAAGLRDLISAPLFATMAATMHDLRSAAPTLNGRHQLMDRYLTHLAEARAEASSDAWHQIEEGVGQHPHESEAPSTRTRQELVEYLARAQLAGERQLLATALKWLDEHGGRGARLRIPDWSDRVAAYLNATGLFIDAGGGELRFTHYSFAEYFLAVSRARQLPLTFDPEDSSWLETVHGAIKRQEVDVAVLIQHGRQTGSSEALLVWLEAGHNDHRLLAGRLLAEGATADRAHVSAFLGSLRQWAREFDDYDDGPTWLRWEVAAQLEDHGIQAFLREVATSGEGSLELRIQSIRALATRDLDLALNSIKALVADPETDEFFMPEAVLTLVELDESCVTEAARILRSLIARTDSNPYDRLAAIEALAELDPSFEEEAVEILRAMMSSEETSSGIRVQAAEALGDLGPQHLPEAEAALRGSAVDRSIEHASRRDAAQALARLGRRYVEEAAGYLRTLADSPDVDDSFRWCIASAIAELGEQHIPEAATILRRLIDTPHFHHEYPWSAAQALASLGPQYLGEAANDLRVLIADPRLEESDRVRTAEVLATLDPRFVPEAADVLRIVLADPGRDLQVRYESAEGLAGLGPQYGPAALRSLIGDPLTPQPLKEQVEQLLAGLVSPPELEMPER